MNYFSIANFPYKYSNIASEMFYSSISAEFLRNGRPTSSCNGFCSTILENHDEIGVNTQGTELNIIIISLSKIVFRHTEDFLKFKVKQEDIIKSITSEVSCNKCLMKRVGN